MNRDNQEAELLQVYFENTEFVIFLGFQNTNRILQNIVQRQDLNLGKCLVETFSQCISFSLASLRENIILFANIVESLFDDIASALSSH